MADSSGGVVLVINSGSSSLKYKLVEPESGKTRAGGSFRRSASRHRGLATMRRLCVWHSLSWPRRA